jgi:hypothetical protein
MSIQNALTFIRRAREDETLTVRLRSQGHNLDLQYVITLAAQGGLTFSEQELREAFSHDWAMRWLRVCVGRAST